MTEIRNMSLDEINHQIDELYTLLQLTRDTGTYHLFDWNGMDYWDASRRSHQLCNELLRRPPQVIADALILYRYDLIKDRRYTHFSNIAFCDFKISMDTMHKVSIILFIDDDGRTRILKNRYAK